MTSEEEGDATAPSASEIQARVLAYWESTGVPEAAAAGRRGGPPFRFTEGPPTANGAPHIGHVIARTLKDVHLRYRRMRGFEIVTPMAGWDCHGLPVELEVEKRHGLRSKKEIESYGVDRFCEECRVSTLEVAGVWREMSRRLGYWLDYDHPYMTMDAPYIESVWWSLKTLFDKGLLEKGYYVLPYCPRCETPLSSHEVAQGYRETTDPSVTFRFPLAGTGSPPRRLLVWTTTPWTIPSNLLVAARADLAYVGIRADDGAEEILAEAALQRHRPHGAEVLHRYTGAELLGLEYVPPYPFAGPGPGRYRIVLDPMVDAAEGTGFVHIAPSFGPEDQRVGEREGVGAFDPLDSRGHFTSQVPLVEGRSFKAADALLLADLESRGLVDQKGTLRHTYPFCWRCSNPLLYRAIDSWFVRTRRFAPALVRHNRSVGWVPAHMRDGRFGNFLDEAKDWALSRNRYWGTPLPIWRCDAGHATCVGSFEELARRWGRPLPQPFDPHRVSVDPIVFPCSVCGTEARREPYTIDGWYDSGAAPFAQYHYPFEPGPFRPEVPLDFVAEGLDQTRGWFYTLLVLATALFDRPAYLHCVVNGLVLDDSGQKMSKSKGNAVEPLSLLERHGADAVRWGFLVSDFTEPIKLSETAMRQASNRTLGTFAHATAFYLGNARADRLEAARTCPKARHLLDRWLLSRLDGTIGAVGAALDSYDPRQGAYELRSFVDDLSTWYLRRSRPRFWSDEDPVDRTAANDTLSFALLTVARLLAPFAPFTAEHAHQELSGRAYATREGSVHLTEWPAPLGRRDVELEAEMARLRSEVEVGRELRQRVGVKSRIPLERFVLVEAPRVGGLGEEGDRLLADELNVRAVERITASDAGRFDPTDFALRQEPDGRTVALLSRRPTPELLREGLVREALRRLQTVRKELKLSYLDRVRVALWADGELYEALEGSTGRIAEELLADDVELRRGAPDGPTPPRMWEIGERRLYARVDRAAPGDAGPPGSPS